MSISLRVNIGLKILVVTACGKRKDVKSQPAWKLYKSPRIRAVYNRRNGHDMAILSSKHGLVKAEQVISPYEETLTEQRKVELVPQVAESLEDYDSVVYYRGGAGKAYFNLIEEACETACKVLVSIGYKNLGDIGAIPQIIKQLEQDSKLNS